MTQVDSLNALLAKLQTTSSVTAVCAAERIKAKVPESITSGYFVVVTEDGGIVDRYVPISRPRFTLRIYGPNHAQAKALYYLIRDAVLPNSRGTGWLTAADARVLDADVLEPIPLVDGDWPYFQTTVSLVYLESAVAV